MTGFSGIYSKSENIAIPDTYKSEIKKHLSRSKEDVIELCDYPYFCLASYDIGAYVSPSLLQSDNGSIIKIAGRAYVSGNSNNGRLEDARLLMDGFLSNNDKALKSSRGSFCGIIYLKHDHRACLFTDLLGVRPIYLTECGPFFIFSTSFRALTSLSFVTNCVDEIGAIQRGFLGYAHGNRTPLSNVSVTFGGELIILDSGNAQRTRYSMLENTDDSNASTKEQADSIYRIFMESVQLRCESKNFQRSLLSGGLDSRLIVSALRESNVDVDTYCMATAGQQDYVFSNLFAEAVGTKHRFIDEQDGFRHQTARLKQYMDDQIALGNPVNAHLLWSGDGGSVGLGFVYLDDDLKRIQAFNRPQKALHRLAEIKGGALSWRLMRKSQYKTFRDKFIEDLRAAMLINPNDHIERNLRFYYLLNDQRCHLHASLEDIDLHRIEFVLPFFDADLMKAMASIPVHLGLRHHFYSIVMKAFPECVSTTPWQAYPNHDPCPLPIPDDLIYQWDENDILLERSVRANAEETLRRSLFIKPFPKLYSRPRMLALSLLEYFGLSNRSYALIPFLALARATDHEMRA